MLLNLTPVVLQPDFWQATVFGGALRLPILKFLHWSRVMEYEDSYGSPVILSVQDVIGELLFVHLLVSNFFKAD